MEFTNVRLAQYSTHVESKRSMASAVSMHTKHSADESQRGLKIALAAAILSWAAAFTALLLSDDPYLNVLLILLGMLCGLAGVCAVNAMTGRN